MLWFVPCRHSLSLLFRYSCSWSDAKFNFWQWAINSFYMNDPVRLISSSLLSLHNHAFTNSGIPSTGWGYGHILYRILRRIARKLLLVCQQPKLRHHSETVIYQSLFLQLTGARGNFYHSLSTSIRRCVGKLLEKLVRVTNNCWHPCVRLTMRVNRWCVTPCLI